MSDPTLCTAADVLGRLQQPATDAGVVAGVDAVRLAVEEQVLALTGYDWTGGIMSETQIDVQLGVSRLMRKRPLLPISADPLKTVRLQARSLASSTFNAIIGDIRDALTGRIMPLASELTPIFPPVGGLAPWFRWRQMIWPTVIFTYKVDPLGSGTNPVPETLRRAAVEWTAFIWTMPSAGALQSVSVEGVSETYFMKPNSAPPIVRMLLSRHVRADASMVF